MPCHCLSQDRMESFFLVCANKIPRSQEVQTMYLHMQSMNEVGRLLRRKRGTIEWKKAR